MTVGELAEQLNELYTEAAKNGTDIENYTIVTDCGYKGFSGEFIVDTEKRVICFEQNSMDLKI